MMILRLAVKWLMSTEGIISISSLIVIVIISLLFIKGRKNFKGKDRRLEANMEGLRKKYKGMSVEEIAGSMVNSGIPQKVNTINIYKASGLNSELYKTMIHWLVRHIRCDGFTIFMDSEELAKVKTWSTPVLVIMPETMQYFYHNDQKEDRTKSRAFEISGHDLGQVYSEVDNAIALMRGLNV